MILADFSSELISITLLSMVSFVLATTLTPVYSTLAYRYRFWKRQRTTSTDGKQLEVFTKLHAEKFKRQIPTMAGVIGVVAITIVTLALNLDRSQTYLPLAALLGGAAIGLIDDIINVRGNGIGVAGMRSGIKFFLLTSLAAVLGWFFFVKLGYSSIHVPYVDAIQALFPSLIIPNNLELGWLIVPIFIFIIVATGNAVNISDGLDGLAGGLLTISFGTFGIIALVQGNVGIAGFCFTVVGALLSYVWFNIPPARFFMGDVGSFAFGTALGVVAMLTNTLFLLPIIGVLFVIEVGSSALQIFSKKVFKKKVFLSAPIHHHLEATGWPEEKVTMRFWVIACIAGFFGLLVAFSGGFV